MLIVMSAVRGGRVKEPKIIRRSVLPVNKRTSSAAGEFVRLCVLINAYCGRPLCGSVYHTAFSVSFPFLFVQIWPRRGQPLERPRKW